MNLDKQLDLYEKELAELKTQVSVQYENKIKPISNQLIYIYIFQEFLEQKNLEELHELKDSLMKTYLGLAKGKIDVYDIRINESKERIQKIKYKEKFMDTDFDKYRKMNIFQVIV